MPVTQRDLAWIAADLLPEIHNQNRKRVRVRHRLTSLLNELEKPMKFRITEDVFFFGQERKVGEIMEAPVGPYRLNAQGQRIPQFVELSQEIHVVTDNAANSNLGQQVASANATAAPATPLPPAPSPAPGSFAEATASVLKPAQPAPKATQPASTASRYSALATRRKKLHQFLHDGANAYESRLAGMETQAPQVLSKANSLLDDEENSMKDLEDSLTEFAGANGGPLQG